MEEDVKVIDLFWRKYIQDGHHCALVCHATAFLTHHDHSKVERGSCLALIHNKFFDLPPNSYPVSCFVYSENGVSDGFNILKGWTVKLLGTSSGFLFIVVVW